MISAADYGFLKSYKLSHSGAKCANLLAKLQTNRLAPRLAVLALAQQDRHPRPLPRLLLVCPVALATRPLPLWTAAPQKCQQHVRQFAADPLARP